MLYDLFRSRLFQGTVVFCVLIIAGFYFGSRYLYRDLPGERPEDIKAFLQSLENAMSQNTSETADSHEWKSQPVVSDGETSENSSEILSEDNTNAELPGFLEDSDTADTIDEPTATSDFPEVPEGFPASLIPVWVQFPNYQKGDMYDHEMMYRVLIKLWNQGDNNFVNVVYDYNYNKVYPLYDDVLYVEWEEKVIDSPDGPIELKYPGIYTGTGTQTGGDALFTPQELVTGSYLTKYPSLKFIELATAGYNPQTFLTDNER